MGDTEGGNLVPLSPEERRTYSYWLKEIRKAIKIKDASRVKELAIEAETIRVAYCFVRAIDTGNMEKAHEYGTIIRRHFMERPRTAITVTTGSGNILMENVAFLFMQFNAATVRAMKAVASLYEGLLTPEQRRQLPDLNREMERIQRENRIREDPDQKTC